VKPGHITANVQGNALRIGRALALPLAVSAASSCNIVQGFQDAGDALFPPQKTYLETPGFRLAEGDFRRLNVGVGDELYLLARSSNDTDPSLFSMRYVDPKPCKLSNVVRYWSSGLPTDYPAQLLYFESDIQRGTLHFADTRCNVHDLVLEDAEFPRDERADGLLLMSGTKLLLVDPAVGRVDTIREGVQGILPSGPGGHVLIVDGKLESYTDDWDFIDRVGDGVVAIRGVGGVFLYEDSTGVHALGAFGGAEGPSLFVTDVDPDGCRLGWVSGSKIAYYSPCAEGKLAVWDASTSHTTPIDYPADPASFAFEADPKASATSAHFPDGYWFYSLRDFTADGGSTLVARSPEGDELVLGTNAKLDRTKLDSSGDYGLTVLDAAGELGRLVRWERDGTVTTLAENMFLNSGDLIVHWNGAVGDRARLTSEGELEVLLTGVPRRDFDYTDEKNRWRAVFDHSTDGLSGTLSIAPPSARDYAGKHAIALNVRHPRHEFLDVVLPGIAYVSNYDAATDTGTLEYNNLELGFRGTVSDGVSDFIPTGTGILYTVPFGRAKGVWLARAE
jgi:hypothetical protein